MNRNRLSDSISTAAALSAGCASTDSNYPSSSKNWRWGRSHVSLVASFEEARSNIGF
jgi:hypothetical protein